MMHASFPALAEAWLPAFILASGMTLGALVTLAVGHLLREAWLAPLHRPLAAIALGAPVLLPLAAPLLVATPSRDSSWYDPDVVVLRSVAVLLLWVAIGRLLAREGVSRRGAGGALLVLVLSGAIAMEDWAVSRDPAWTGSLQGVALLVEQAGAALALATLLALRGGMPDQEARTGLERALLSLAMATLWLWFVQYVVVYAADLPPEAAWYGRRSTGGWGVLKLGIAVPALLAAIGLALVPQWRSWRLFAVCVLMLIHHLAHLVWVVRPDVAVTGGATSAAADALVAMLVASCVAFAWRRAARLQPG